MDQAEKEKPTCDLRTFERAFAALPYIRTMRCKGNHTSCALCTAAADLLTNRSKKYSSSQKDAVRYYRRKHIRLQATERVAMMATQDKCTKVDPETNQPLSFFIMMDAISNCKTELPRKKPKDHIIGHDGRVANRLMGVEVTCGPVQGIFNYHLGSEIEGGGNLIVECMRQAMADMTRLLAKEGLRLPKTGYFQFDNCSENKNKVITIFICFVFLFLTFYYYSRLCWRIAHTS